MVFHSIGKSVLNNTLIEAAFMFTHTNCHVNRSYLIQMASSKEAFMFVFSSSLDIMIETYRLSYDANKIRSKFWERFNLDEDKYKQATA